MTLAAADRAQARRRAGVLAEPAGFETHLGPAVAPPPAAPAIAGTQTVQPATPAPAPAVASDLTGAQMDVLMANFGKADVAPPIAAAGAAPASKPAAPADSAAVAALKSAPAAANLTPEQMTALLSGFGQAGGPQMAAASPDTLPATEAAGTDTMSATKFFLIQRKADAPPSLYASPAIATDNSALSPAAGRFFPIKPTGAPVASLYATPPEVAIPATAPAPTEPAPTPAIALAPPVPTSLAATARFYPVDGSGHPNPSAAATARDAYLRAMDVNARMLGLSSRR